MSLADNENKVSRKQQNSLFEIVFDIAPSAELFALLTMNYLLSNLAIINFFNKPFRHKLLNFVIVHTAT
jgi:hypothetical protein